MAEQLADLEVKVAVSMWQTAEPGSDTGRSAHLRVANPGVDEAPSAPGGVQHNAACARAALWRRLNANYVR
ncbi:hypothetical protein [Streptomyces torulosus]|uniref:hypothetical protein n=1 Tax=Streptomyces torulosus TaxID=68276 RepID=UPI0012FF3569|nr:hypothetical protein [Streptomyces torulosus]